MRCRRLLTSILLVAFPLTATGIAGAQPAADDYADPDASDYADPDASDYEDPDAGGEGGGEAGPKPPAKGKGAVIGVIKESSGPPALEAVVEVVGKPDFKTATDLDGKYRLDLPPGEYELRITYPQHKLGSIQNLVIKENAFVRGDLKLEINANEKIEEVVVTTKVDTSGEEGVLLARQKSAAVGDAISREEIAKTPDSNAAQAAQRVVGANIVGGRFVYVRGLGERYTNALINGAPLPSPEPDRAAVPLNVVPTMVVDAITINKTFTPDVPGDMTGGSVRVTTRSIPDELFFKVSLKGEVNTQASFQERVSSPGGGLDFLGIDDGSRALPDGVPDSYLLRVNAAKDQDDQSAGRVTTEELSEIGRRFVRPGFSFGSERVTSPLNYGFSAVAGNGWTIGNEMKVGVMGSVNYGQSFQAYEVEQATFISINGRASPTVEYTGDYGVKKTRWGAFGAVELEFNPKHKLTLIGLRSHLADDEAWNYDGFDRINDADFRTTHIAWSERYLNFLQLSGEHEFEELNNGKLEWNASVAEAIRTDPNTRDIVYQQGDTGDYSLLIEPGASRHVFLDMDETAIGSGFDWTQPVGASQDSRIKFGGAASVKDRSFTGRRMFFRQANRSAGQGLICPRDEFSYEDCAGDILNESTVGVDANGDELAFRLEENTQPSDAYTAELDILAAYLMADAELFKGLRVIAGARVESTRQTVTPFNQLSGLIVESSNFSAAELNTVNALPAVALVYSATKSTKFRAAATRTLARPQLRELAPFFFISYFGGRGRSGNPNLRLTQVTNIDLRVEHFPTLTEVLALSIFAKSFTDPIEPVITPNGGNGFITYQNAEGATLLGVEAEARKNLGFITTAFKDVSVIGNLTLNRSSIRIEQTGRGGSSGGFITNTDRPMVNQAPWVVNVALDYNNDEIGTAARVLYNVSGPRIVGVGTVGLDDEYEHPRHFVDLTASQKFLDHFEVALTAQNLLNFRRLVTQGEEERGDNIVLRYREGTTVELKLGYEY